MKNRITTSKIEEADRRVAYPRLGNVACSRTTSVMQAIAIPRACHPSWFISIENVTPNASEFPDEKLKRMTYGCEKLGMMVHTFKVAPFTTRVTGSSEI